MSSPFMDLPVNPFGKDVVKQPRDCGHSVSSLNHGILSKLKAEFRALSEGKPPRKARRAEKAQLILSPAPGYGKSHLIGRLFSELGEEATSVYIPPFQSVSLCWQSVLWHVVSELDAAESTMGNPLGSTQLDSFAQGVIRNLVASAVRHGTIHHDDPDWAADLFAGDPMMNLRDGIDDWSVWLRNNFLQRLMPHCREELKRNGVDLKGKGWLKVLYEYAIAAPSSDDREACLSWLRCEPLEEGESTKLGISSTSAVQHESLTAVNEVCWSRIYDLCQLAAFYRPFLFCFDQTEDYAGEVELVQQFGRVVVRLVNQHPNQLTIVTANRPVWEGGIWPRFDLAHHDRFTTGMDLDKVASAEAEKLIRLRLSPFSVPEEVISRFVDSAWLATCVPAPAREFMRQCRERWDGGGRHSRKPLDTIFAEFRAEQEAQPSTLAYEPDIFRWLVKEPLAADDGIVVKKFEEQSLLETLWETPVGDKVVFGFFREAHHFSWKNIAMFAMNWQHRHNGVVAKVVLFRTAELDPIPKPSWPIIGPLLNKTKQTCLDLITLSKEQTAELFAAQHLYWKTNAGDVEGYEVKEVALFLGKALANWRARILQPAPFGNQPPPPPPPPPPADQLIQLSNFVQREKFVSVDAAISKLGPAFTKDLIFTLCEKLPKIQKIIHPNMALLVWQG